eukprot:gene29097-38526_t
MKTSIAERNSLASQAFNEVIGSVIRGTIAYFLFFSFALSECHELPLLCGSPKEAWPVSLALELEISQSKSDSARKETFYWVKNKEIVQIDKLDNLGELACKNGSRLINSVLHQNNLKVKNMQSMAGQGRLYLQCTALAEFPARVSYFDQRESGIGERAATARERADRMRKLRFPSQSTAQALTEFRPG